MDEFGDYMDAVGPHASSSVTDMIVRFLLNLIVVFGMSRLLYYPKGKRRDYLFVFVIISISIFLMVYLLGSLKLKIGFALGLFAIFGIMRFRTEQMPVREMTYLFVIIALSVINALSQSIGIWQLIISNGLLIFAIWMSERELWLKNIHSKLVVYDDVTKIRPEQRAELISDLEKRLGIKIVTAEVGHVDFVRDMAMIRVFYEADSSTPSSDDIENMRKFPKEV